MIKKKYIEFDVRKLIDEEVFLSKKIDQIESTDNLVDLGMNSITFIKLIVNIEKKYNIEFSNDIMIMDRFRTINDFVEYIFSVL